VIQPLQRLISWREIDVSMAWITSITLHKMEEEGGLRGGA
jgi:hypothetical protein